MPAAVASDLPVHREMAAQQLTAQKAAAQLMTGETVAGHMMADHSVPAQRMPGHVMADQKRAGQRTTDHSVAVQRVSGHVKVVQRTDCQRNLAFVAGCSGQKGACSLMQRGLPGGVWWDLMTCALHPWPAEYCLSQLQGQEVAFVKS